MPRHGKNIHRTASGRWDVRFKTKETGPDGVVRWRSKRKTFDSRADAEAFRDEVRLRASRGELWQDERTLTPPPCATLGELVRGFNEAATSAPKATREFRASVLRAWEAWAGADTPASVLSAALLERYAATLPARGRTAVTKHRKVLAVEKMWRWARRRPDLYPGVPEPAQITGPDGVVQQPHHVTRLDVPSWDDVDAMIRAIRRGYRHGDGHRRVALVLRYTGLRVAQVVGLRWDDVRLDHATPYVVVRAGRAGAKGGKGRALPLHPALVADLRSWGPSTGPIFRPTGEGDAPRRSFRTAWVAAGVDREKWDVSDAERAAGERAHGSPCHAIRAAVRVGLLRAGVAEGFVDYLLGHGQGATKAAYVPEAAPETSPYWDRLVEAVGKIPAFTAGDPPPTPGTP